MKLHWYIPFRDGNGSFCGRIARLTYKSRITNEPVKVTCLHCIKLMEAQGVKTAFGKA